MKVGVIEYVDCAHSARIKGQDYPLHGHTYQIECSVEGPLKDDVVYDFCDLRNDWKKVREKYNKENLNEVLENSTGENFAIAVHKDMKAMLPKHLKVYIKLWQGVNKWVEFGD